MELASEVKKWWNQQRAARTVDALTKAGYSVYPVANLEEAKAKILELIPEGSSITMGGSSILDEMGMVEIFRTPKYKFFDRYQKLPFIPDRVEIMRQGMLADYMVSGCNAITEKGELVNRDCTGNRVAGMIFGPQNVIMVAGVNKVVKDIPAAFDRISEIAAPMNARRLGTHKTGCVETGICTDCDTAGRLCNYTTVIHNGKKFPGRISIVFVVDEVGF